MEQAVAACGVLNYVVLDQVVVALHQWKPASYHGDQQLAHDFFAREVLYLVGL